MKIYEVIKGCKWEGGTSEGLYANKDIAIINLHFFADRHNKEVKLMFSDSDEFDLLEGELIHWDGEKYIGKMNCAYIKEREVIL